MYKSSCACTDPVTFSSLPNALGKALPCYYHHVLHHHFDLFLITKSLLSRGKRASRVGGSRSRWQAGRTSINLHQLKVEEDRHALYQISANYMPSSSRSLQATTTVVLTIIQTSKSRPSPPPVLRVMLAQLGCYRNPVRPTRGTEVYTASSWTALRCFRGAPQSTNPSTANGGVSAFVRSCGN